jgi:hypothetical protein
MTLIPKRSDDEGAGSLAPVKGSSSRLVYIDTKKRPTFKGFHWNLCVGQKCTYHFTVLPVLICEVTSVITNTYSV